MISVVGGVFALLLVACLLARRDLLPWLLSASMPFAATAAFTVAGQSIVAYYMIAVLMIIGTAGGFTLRRVLTVNIAAKPGLRPLIAFTLWAAVVTVIAPAIFSGIEVLNPRDGIDQGIQDPATLSPQISNLAQTGYLAISVATVFALGSMRTLSPRIPAAGFALGTVLSSLKSLLPEGLQRSIFDNSANVSYTAGTFNGIERMRGIFSEPAGLGAFSISAVVFFLLTASAVTGAIRAACVVMAVWAFVNTVLSFSGGSIMAGVAIIAILLMFAISKYVAGALRISGAAMVAAIALIPAAIVFGPSVYGFVNLILSDKAGSASHENRSAADAFSIALSSETFGLGVGLGSNRPSSFFAMLLSCTGILGVALFIVAIVTIIGKALRRGPDYSPAAWALFAVVFSKVIASPDLSDCMMWLLIGVCANGAWRRPSDATTIFPAPSEPIVGRQAGPPPIRSRARYAKEAWTST